MANEIYHRSNWGNAVNDKYWADVYEKYSATNKMYIRSDYYENSNVTDKLMADIYPKPSILLTPTAYDNGSLHSVKPVQSLGDELVLNGEFDTSSNWLFSGWSIQNGKASNTLSGAGNNLYQNSVTSVGKQFKVVIDTTITAGSVIIMLGGGTGGYNTIGEVTTSGTFTYYGVSNGSDNRILLQTGSGTTVGSVSIDNISVKEVIDADFDFTRGSSATRVNEKGLIEDVQVLSGELVTSWSNKDFSAFTSSGSTITEMVSSGSGNNCYYATSFTSGNKYKIEFNSSQNITAQIRISNNDSLTSAQVVFSNPVSGLNSVTFTANANYSFIGFYAASSFTDTQITNFTAIEITDDTNLPRINYTNFDYENGEVVPYSGEGSLLLEPQSTNLIAYSEDFTNSYWGHNADITVTNSSELAPNGALNAYLIEYDGSGYSFIRVTRGSTYTTSTLSVFAKKGNWRYLGLRNFQDDGNDHTVFDFDTETFPNIAAGQNASFEIFPNGWYRIIINQPSPSSSPFIGFSLTNSTGSELNTTGGQVANVHLFGAQLEQSSYPSSYIPTEGSTVTRLADVCNNAGSSDLINSTEGVLYCEAATLVDPTSVMIIGLSDGTAANRISITFHSTLNRIQIFAQKNSVQLFNIDNTSVSKTNFNKIAISYSSTSAKFFLNGTLVASATPSDMFAANTLDRVNFDIGSGSNKFEGKVKTVAVFEALDNDELERLTGEGYETFKLLAQANNYTII